MKIYTCIVVDDEPLARKLLQDYLDLLPNMKLLGCCKNAGEAIAILQDKEVDILFCDIKMPGVSGLQFLKSLYKPSKIIITTAYRDYAVEGFEIGVVDYLLKPISVERFLQAINRALGINKKEIKPIEFATEDFMFFKTGNSTERVFLNNIDFIEAYGNYCKLHLIDANRFLAVNYKISELEKDLKSKKFIRIHKSYIVNEIYIAKMSSNALFVNAKEVPISDSYKKDVMGILKVDK